MSDAYAIVGVFALLFALLLALFAAVAVFGPTMVVIGERLALWANRVCRFRTDK